MTRTLWTRLLPRRHRAERLKAPPRRKSFRPMLEHLENRLPPATFNVAAGVSVGSGTGDSILGNSIFANGHLGIDLVAPGDPPSGVTPNQPGLRVGPNNLQNYPVMVAAVVPLGLLG